MSRGLLLAAAVLLLVQSTIAVRVTHSHALVRRNQAFEEEQNESEFPLCPSPDSDDQMECPKRNGICCSFEGRPTGRCCAQGETCTSDETPQCVAYAGMRHLDRLVEKIDTGLNHVDHLDEGDAPAVLVSNKDDSPSKSSKSSGSIRDDKLELLRSDLLSLEGNADKSLKYLNKTEYDDIEKELRTLAPQDEDFSPPKNETEETPEQQEQEREDALRREASEEAERKEKEIEYMKQRENAKDKIEDNVEAEVERENGKLVDEEIRRDAKYGHRVVRVVRRVAPAPRPQPTKSVVVDHVNILEQQKRVAELKAKIAELEEPLKLQIEPDEAAVHALNYLKARLREMEEEGLHPTDSHKNNAREFLRAIESAPSKAAVVTSNGCDTGSTGDCITTSTSSDDDVPVAIATKITSFLPAGSLPTPCPVGVRC